MVNSHIRLSNIMFKQASVPGLAIPGAVYCYWKMDEPAGGDAIDQLGNYDLTDTGAVPSEADGIFTNCRGGFSSASHFEAVGSRYLPEFKVYGGTTFVYEAFFKPSAASTTQYQTIFGATEKYSGVHYTVDSGKAFTLRGYENSSNILDNASVSPLPTYEGNWTHMMFAKTGEGTADSINLYINGVLIDSAAGYSGSSTQDNDFAMGLRLYATSYPAQDLKLCEAALWTDLTTGNVPGVGTVQARVAAIALARYNGGAGSAYII